MSGLLFATNFQVSQENGFLDYLMCRCFGRDVLLWLVNVIFTCNLVFISLERFSATCYLVKHRNMLNAQNLKIAIGTAGAIEFASASIAVITLKNDKKVMNP